MTARARGVVPGGRPTRLIIAAHIQARVERRVQRGVAGDSVDICDRRQHFVQTDSTFLGSATCAATGGATCRLAGDRIQPTWRLAGDSIGWREARRQHCLTGLHAVNQTLVGCAARTEQYGDEPPGRHGVEEHPHHGAEE